MAGRRTNLALLVLLGAGFLTGVSAYAVGTEWNRWIVVAHGILGFAIVILAPWKQVVVRRGLMRRRRGTRASLVFLVLLVAVLTTGVVHATGILRVVGPVTAMQFHVGAALVALPLAVWHVVARRIRVHRTDVSRRQLIKSGALLGGAGAAYVAVEGVMHAASLPGADRRFTGSFERGSFVPDEMPVTQWLDDSVPEIDAMSWRLIARSNNEIRVFGYEDIAAFDDRLTATLDCTGGWFAEQQWEGVFLGRLFDDVADARSINVVSATGYGRRFPVSALDNLLLATRVGGMSLSPGHGHPARIVAPGRRELLVGEVGHVGRAERHAVVVAIPVPAYVGITYAELRWRNLPDSGVMQGMVLLGFELILILGLVALMSL